MNTKKTLRELALHLGVLALIVVAAVVAAAAVYASQSA